MMKKKKFGSKKGVVHAPVTGRLSSKQANLRPAVESEGQKLARILRICRGAEAFLKDILTDLHAKEMSARARSYVEVAQQATSSALIQLEKDANA